MKALRNYLDKIKPNFEEGGKLHAFRSVFDGFETFLFVPNSTSKTGVHIHDAIDSKRIMSMVVIALIPALLFGMYNVGYQHFLAVGQEAGFFEKFIYGFLAVLPKIIVSYVVGLGIEFAMTALFTVIFVEQWLAAKQHGAVYIAIAAILISTALFQLSNFLLPALILLVILLVIFQDKVEKKEDAS